MHHPCRPALRNTAAQAGEWGRSILGSGLADQVHSSIGEDLDTFTLRLAQTVQIETWSRPNGRQAVGIETEELEVRVAAYQNIPAVGCGRGCGHELGQLDETRRELLDGDEGDALTGAQGWWISVQGYGAGAPLGDDEDGSIRCDEEGFGVTGSVGVAEGEAIDAADWPGPGFGFGESEHGAVLAIVEVVTDVADVDAAAGGARTRRNVFPVELRARVVQVEFGDEVALAIDGVECG